MWPPNFAPVHILETWLARRAASLAAGIAYLQAGLTEADTDQLKTGHWLPDYSPAQIRAMAVESLGRLEVLRAATRGRLR